MAGYVIQKNYDKMRFGCVIKTKHVKSETDAQTKNNFL